MPGRQIGRVSPGSPTRATFTEPVPKSTPRAARTPVTRGSIAYMHNRIAVVGSLNIDLVVELDRMPSAGETVFGTSLQRHPGGKGLNQAVAAPDWSPRFT